MEKKTKKLERKKEAAEGTGGTISNTSNKMAKRKIEREEERLKLTNRDLSMFRMKSMVWWK